MPRLHSASLHSAEMLLWVFPPSFVAIFAREPSDATSITQAPFRFSTLFRPCRCIAVRHPCFVATTEGGKRIFKTNERKPRTTKLEPLEWQDTAPRRLLCELRSEAIHRAPTLRTLHNVRAPSRSQRLYEGDTCF